MTGLARVGTESFLTHPDTKAIQTALLVGLEAFIVWRERELFFGGRSGRHTWRRRPRERDPYAVR